MYTHIHKKKVKFTNQTNLHCYIWSLHVEKRFTACPKFTVMRLSCMHQDIQHHIHIHIHIHKYLHIHLHIHLHLHTANHILITPTHSQAHGNLHSHLLVYLQTHLFWFICKSTYTDISAHVNSHPPKESEIHKLQRNPYNYLWSSHVDTKLTSPAKFTVASYLHNAKQIKYTTNSQRSSWSTATVQNGLLGEITVVAN